MLVHLAANTHVDRCEVQPEEAYRINDGGTAIVASVARDVGARVVYVSTDYVFSGEEDGEYAEGDPTEPLNVYGMTKLAGEGRLDPGIDLIVRSSWVFGAGRNFMEAVIDAGKRGPVRVVEDQRGRPTSAVALATALAHLVGTDLTGTIHVAGDGEPCSWADLAEIVLEIAGAPGMVQRIDTETYVAEAEKVVAPRPRNSALALDKAKGLGVPLLDWKRSVRDYMEARR